MRFDAVERVAARLAEDPPLAHARDEDGDPLAFSLHPWMKRREEMIDVLTAHGVDLDARNNAGQTLVERAVAAGWAEFADEVRARLSG